jgi:hypothetical protein
MDEEGSRGQSDYGCFAPDLIARVSYECACRNVSEMPYLGLSDQEHRSNSTLFGNRSYYLSVD